MTNHNPHSGSALVSMIVIIPVLILIVAAYMNLTVSSFKVARTDQFRTHAQLATDSGLDLALQEINLDNNWSGTGAEIELHNDGKVRSTYQVTATTIDADNKTILSVGRTYSPVSSSTPESTIQINVYLRPVTSGEYSVVSGVGGLVMSNSAKILGGDVFINGRVTLSNSAQIGLTTNPVSLSVAHQSCPSPATASYPLVCNSGVNGQPITINNTAKIYGVVKANNQTNGANMSLPGLQTPNCLMPSTGINCITPAPLPTHDRAAQVAAVTTNITGAAASCSSGTRTYAANTRITGNVSISNSCRVTVNGNVWITGSLEVNNSAEMIVSNTLGAAKPVVIVDGATAEFKQSSILRSNSSGSGFQIITYRSSAGCSPDCAAVTGVDLFNSQDITTISLDNSTTAANTIFYARWSKVLVNNSGQIGALIGQTVQLTNSGTITFGTSVGAGTVFWVIDGYRRVTN